MRVLPRASDFYDLDLTEATVVAVDDNGATRRLVTEILRAGGVGQVHAFAGAVEALNQLAALTPDMLIVDWQMPGMDGVTMTRTIRSAALQRDDSIPDPQIPIIMLTGRRRESDVETARRAGVNEFVAKPFAPAALMARVHAVRTRARRFVITEGYIGPDRRRRNDADYAGPRRRATDRGGGVDPRKEALRTIKVELDAIRRAARTGEAGNEAAAMAYRSMLHNIHRARSIRDTAIEQASNSLVRYIDAIGGPEQADAKLIEVHLDALSKLLLLGDGSPAALLVNERLRAAVEKKLKKS